MANGTNPAQLTAMGFEPVLKPATCNLPERIASSWAALLSTGKKTTFFPVHQLSHSMKMNYLTMKTFSIEEKIFALREENLFIGKLYVHSEKSYFY